MNKLALIIASLICFAGCARNDTDSPVADTGTRDSTASGTPAASQSGSDLGVTAPSTGIRVPSSIATNDSRSIRNSGSLIDTNFNSLSNTNTNSLDNATPPLPPGARGQSLENGSNTQPPSNSQANQGGLSPSGNNNSQTPR